MIHFLDDKIHLEVFVFPNGIIYLHVSEFIVFLTLFRFYFTITVVNQNIDII